MNLFFKYLTFLFQYQTCFYSKWTACLPYRYITKVVADSHTTKRRINLIQQLLEKKKVFYFAWIIRKIYWDTIGVKLKILTKSRITCCYVQNNIKMRLINWCYMWDLIASNNEIITKKLETLTLPFLFEENTMRRSPLNRSSNRNEKKRLRLRQ